MSYVARFRNVPGRYLVESEGTGVYGGQKIIGTPGTAAYRTQVERYGNAPDRVTGLMLHESYRTFSAHEIVSIRPFTAER